ncbi:hypothetical protein J6590_033030 [Homalodisca vitripennis]|nr:hypothetical protein J6590_033030 [Homalodisca vitripennis]
MFRLHNTFIDDSPSPTHSIIPTTSFFKPSPINICLVQFIKAAVSDVVDSPMNTGDRGGGAVHQNSRADSGEIVVSYQSEKCTRLFSNTQAQRLRKPRPVSLQGKMSTVFGLQRHRLLFIEFHREWAINSVSTVNCLIKNWTKYIWIQLSTLDIVPVACCRVTSTCLGHSKMNLRGHNFDDEQVETFMPNWLLSRPKCLKCLHWGRWVASSILRSNAWAKTLSGTLERRYYFVYPDLDLRQLYESTSSLKINTYY